MKDINFFKPYNGIDKSEIYKHYYQVMGLSVLGMILLTFSINISKLIILNKEIEHYKNELKRPGIEEKVKISEEVNRQLEALTSYEKDLNIVTKSIDQNNVVSNQLLDAISSTVPKNVNFKSMNINNEIINIQAVATNRQAVAEIEHNLRRLSEIKNVYVETISGNESVQGEYSFNIKCYLNGGGK
jgi:type IV pilus assembly protein PilN